MKRYRAILADPPWGGPNQRGGYGVDRHYPLMSLKEITALPVERLAADSSHIWLWTTTSDWHWQIRVMEAWGFSYRSAVTWTKPRLGMGQYLRSATEHLLFGVRGKAPIAFRSQPTWLFAAVQEHSHKPEEAYAIVERCSPGPYLELFARRKRPGWDVWGNEVESDVEL
ncbi:MT-A70 family methyltransferase [Amycolatopsis azurea]|uniref:MT-A70 family methyltransferase n=1 Tax=Amycolatopsis azurea TaxID=36819 RepID=UPI003807B843